MLWDKIYATKLVNPQLSTDYIAKLSACSTTRFSTWDKAYLYTPIERKVYWLTRQIKGLHIDPSQYQRLFQSEMESDFTPLWSLFRDQGLLDTHYALTSLGRYFADSMAGLLVDYIAPSTLTPENYAMHHSTKDLEMYMILDPTSWGRPSQTNSDRTCSKSFIETGF